jgi:hypothetical protein
MIRRETGGKVRCEQALFVFGIKTTNSAAIATVIPSEVEDSEARRAGQATQDKRLFCH